MQRMQWNGFGIAALSIFLAVGCPSDEEPGAGEGSTGSAETETSASSMSSTSGSTSSAATSATSGTTNDPTPSTTDGPSTATEDSVDTGTSDDSESDSEAESESDSDTDIPGDVEVIELRAGGFEPPAVETFYSCFSFTVSVEQLHHIVGFRPVVDNSIIHHYVLSMAPGEVQLDPNDSCFEWPADILWAWAPGIETTMLPDEAGFLMGDAPGGQHTFVLQVHYNDPLGVGIVDDNGIDVLVTPNLREFPAAIFSQGDIATISIPPGQSDYEHVAECGSVFTEALIDEPIHVFSSFLHAHEIGAGIRTDVIRDGQMVGQVADEDLFDFNQQKFVPADIDIMPGVTLRTTCRYDSTGRSNTTQGGADSDEEMCIDFMMYYPKVQGQKCGSL